MTVQKKIWKRILWTALIVAAIVITTLSFFPSFTERYYTYGVYPLIAAVQRIAFGWLPFSVGDVFYAAVILWFILQAVLIFKRKRAGGFQKKIFRQRTIKVIFLLLLIYVVFYGLWGLNYYRVGIAGQLGLEEKDYSTRDLDTLVGVLHRRLNAQAALLQPAMRDSFRRHKNLFSGAATAYRAAEDDFPFLKYRHTSVKPSLFSYLGNYLGFQGYYNPFTGEAQVNTTVPPVIEPFVATHEIAHQLGYAKESEANFVGFLTCRRHPSVVYVYSVYFNMYFYGIRDLYLRDSVRAANFDSSLHRQVVRDINAYRNFYAKYKNPLEPVISTLYGYFLKMNNQPAGQRSYNEVVGWMIGYYKKFGIGSIE